MTCDVYVFDRKNRHAHCIADQNSRAHIIKTKIWQNVVWETQLVVMTNNARFLLCFWVLNKRKTGSESNISYYRIPFGTDPESLSQKKVDSSNQEYAASISSVISQRKLWWIVRSLVFLFVSVAFKILLLRQAIKRQRFSRLCPIGIFLYSKYWRKEKKFSWLIWKAD